VRVAREKFATQAALATESSRRALLEQLYVYVGLPLVLGRGWCILIHFGVGCSYLVELLHKCLMDEPHAHEPANPASLSASPEQLSCVAG
jgi:hypothetical protein